MLVSEKTRILGQMMKKIPLTKNNTENKENIKWVTSRLFSQFLYSK